AVNDIHGHEAGDRVLVEVARALAHGVRSDDLACRLGGDEFLVICPATPAEGAAILAEKLRATVAELSVHLGAGTWRGSLSVGVAVRDPVSAGPDDLLRRADGCLYLAKRTGRNRVCREDEPAARAA
ncbi:MAG TPA: GGDEF domain-containing protein, partial [Usitatibacteraceae bacterium]|nr:GGDEF domain-containing protein [Usitatibacteraceae bacterium]